MRGSSSTILKLILSFVLSNLLFISLLLPVQDPFRIAALPTFAERVDIEGPSGDANTRVDGTVVDGADEASLYVPVSTTLVVSDTFFNVPYIIGPGPGVMQIDDVIIDGHLVINDGADNYGPVIVKGQLTTRGHWHDDSEWRYVCDPIRDICVDSAVRGYVTNRGLWHSSGTAFLPHGVTNEGHWQNSALVDTGGVLFNTGWMTNSGQILVSDVMWNWGVASNAGLLVNKGTIFNWGTLSGEIDNHGTLYSMGELSATVDGSGSVHQLTRHTYFPFIK